MTFMQIPSSQIGVLSSATSIKLQTFPVPKPGPKDVLVKNVAVASNPKDWKYPDWNPGSTYIEGSDLAGIVVAVGSDVTEFKEGERVAAYTRIGTQDNKDGAYAQFTVAPASTTFLIPDSVTFEEAATLPLAILTAALSLFRYLEIPESQADPQQGIIINGASSSVGAYAVQLAKRAGLFVIGIAGASKDYAKELGADIVIDYREYQGSNLENALIKAAEGHRISHVLDAISENGSTFFLAKVLSKIAPGGEGMVDHVLVFSEEEKKELPPGIKTHHTLVYTVHDPSKDEEFGRAFCRQLSSMLVVSSDNPVPLRPNRVRLIPNGLAGVEQGLSLLKDGKVHGEKLVYRIAETPGLQF